jgi:CDP-diacylglycerol--serine O-phosphatidyltransferase
MFRQRTKRLKGLSFNTMIPNILTMLALCAGMTAMRFGLNEKWEEAILSLTIAAILDSLDGRIARALRGTSKFGAELDSLSDFICFGVTPALLLYIWTMQTAGQWGWVLVLLFSVCCALRLARFNTDIEGPEPPSWTKNYFTGVPVPAGAGLVLLPMIISFQTDWDLVKQPFFVAIFIFAVSGLLVSQLPTYSFKSLRIQHRFILLTMLVVGLVAALAASAPWLTLTIILIFYIISIPLGLQSYKRQKDKASKIAVSLDTNISPGPEE